MADLWWVSWVFWATVVLGLAAWCWLGIWWFRRRAQKKIVFLNAERLRHAVPGVGRNAPARAIAQIPLESPQWRPPPRASLLQRQQLTNRLGNTPDRTSDRTEGQRSSRRTAPARASVLPKGAPLLESTAPKTAPTTEMISTTALLGHTSGHTSGMIGQRKGLESLVTLDSEKTATVPNNDSRTS